MKAKKKSIHIEWLRQRISMMTKAAVCFGSFSFHFERGEDPTFAASWWTKDRIRVDLLIQHPFDDFLSFLLWYKQNITIHHIKMLRSSKHLIRSTSSCLTLGHHQISGRVRPSTPLASYLPFPVDSNLMTSYSKHISSSAIAATSITSCMRQEEYPSCHNFQLILPSDEC